MNPSSGHPERSAPQPGAAPLPPSAGDESFYRQLVDSARDHAIVRLTPDGHVVSWNTGAEQLTGTPAGEAIGRHFSTFYPRSAIDREWPQDELRRAAADGRYEDEGWRLRKDGTPFWVNVVFHALRAADGTLLGFTAVARDLTARREREQRLRESERSLRLLVNGVQDYAIFRLDPHGIVSSWNLGAQRIKGYDADEIIGKHFSIFYPPEQVARGWPEHELREAIAHGHFEDEGWRVRKDGTLFWANVVITTIRTDEGEVLGFSKVTRDLTERRRHEELLRESEEKLRLLVEGVRDHAMFLLSPEGTVATWNLGAQRVLGYEAEQVLGQPLDLFYTEEERAAGRPVAELRSARHAGHFEVDGWRVTAAGDKLWAQSAWTALLDGAGRLRGFVHIVRDLTERVRVQELEDESRRIQQFIAMLSHELRNPLAPIASAASILKRSSRDPQVAWCADLISRQSSHLKRLVDDLLDVSRITTGKIQVQPTVLELNTLVQLACDSALPSVTQARHRLDVKLAPQSVFVQGDSTRLTQVVANLLSNATKYTPQGGYIEVSVERNHTVATLQVTDTGIGMSEALMARAFDPFVQGARALDRGNGGLGIGLTLVKSIIDLHGGSVTVSSAGENRGTRFTVTLPLAACVPMSAPRSPAEPAATACAGPLRVLVVDDNHDAADGLATLLRRQGHQVHLAHDGPSALVAVDQHRPDVVLLDLSLPGMNGYEVARRVRANPQWDAVVLIALSGYGQATDRESSRVLGFQAHLLKPVEASALTEALAGLQQREPGDEARSA